MPYRTYPLILGLAGIVTIIMLLVARANLAEHTRSGPRWKRHLVAAGLLLLATLGLAPALGTGCSSQSGPTPLPDSAASGDHDAADATEPQAPAKAASLDRSPQWRQIAEIMAEAEKIAASKRGSYPFDDRGRKRILGELETAGANADLLQNQSLLGPGEAALVKLDLTRLAGKVSEFRTTEERMMSCYQERRLLPPAKVSMHRLGQRLPLLEKLAANQALHPRAVAKALDKIQADVELLESEEELGQLADHDEQNDARRLATDVKAQLAKVRGRISSRQ